MSKRKLQSEDLTEVDLPPNVHDVKDVEWVNLCKTDADRERAARWTEFAKIYPRIADELFDNDPDLTSRDPREVKRGSDRH